MVTGNAALTNLNGHPSSGTTTQRDAITSWEAGEHFFNTTTGRAEVYTGTYWSTSGSVQSNVAAAGSQQSNAAALLDGFQTVTGADGTKGVILPASIIGRSVRIKNDETANAVLKIYPPASSAINGLGANNAYSAAANSAGEFLCVSSTAWVTIPKTLS